MPISTWLGGDCMVPSAWRSSDSTMTMRVNAVIISTMAGMKVNPVMNSSICRLSE